MSRPISAAFLVAAIALSASTAEALIIDFWDGPDTPNKVNLTAPDDDPGWANVANNRGGVYLGNQWVLTATHANTGRIDTSVGSFAMIPGTEVQLTNPNSFGSDSSLDTFADLSLFRVTVDATTGMTPEELGMAPVTLASRLPTSNDVLTMIGRGTTRVANRNQFPSTGQQTPDPNGHYHWNVSGGNVVRVTNTQVSQQQGYFAINDRELSWGRNVISSPTGVSATRSGERLLIEFSNANRADTIGFVTRFDRGITDNNTPIDDGRVEYETQAAGGDSGGGVFYKDGDDWVLAGVMHAIYEVNSNQPDNQAWFGSHTAISDLSDPHYRSQIEALRVSNQYSALGDIDLDGVVSGDIVNGVATGDLQFIVDNYGQTNDVGIKSWLAGDISQNGVTGFEDFLMLRAELNGSLDVTAFQALVGIPEPTSLCLFVLAAACVRRRS